MGDNIITIPTAAKRLGGDMGKVDGTLKPLLECEYIIKALQNSKNIKDLTWDSTGNKANYNADGAIKTPVWYRCGISCCAEGDDETPRFIVGDYDGCAGDKHGNKNFKAVMIRGGLKVTIPAYTTASVYVTMAASLFKYGGETSSSWAGGIVSDSDSWKTVNDDNHNGWANYENSGVLPANDSDHITICQSDKEDWCTYKLGIVNYDNGEIVNETEQEIRQETKPIYIVCMVEKANSINQRLIVVDDVPGENTIDADVLYRSRIIYTGEGVDTEEKHEYVFSYKRPTAVKFRKTERPGYQLGWLEEATGRFYPPICYFSEQRGIKLTAQWTALSVAYNVEHYLQKVDGTYSDTPDYIVAGKNLAGADAIVPIKEYTGYGKPKWEPAKVNGDGSTVIKCYYPILEFSIEFCANGGTFRDDGTDFRVIKEVYSNPIMIITPELNEREGYKFERWEPKIPSVMPGKTVTTRAVWTKLDNYYVEYEGEGATGGTMLKQTFEMNKSQKLEPNTFVQKYEVTFDVDSGNREILGEAEYLFTGWAKESGGPKVYDDEAVVRNLTTTTEATVTLYAVWEKQGVTPPDIEQDGYYFDGWYEDKEFKERAVMVDGKYIPTEDTTLYGRMISKEIPDIGWYQNENESVDQRRIYACWHNDNRIKSYKVYLFYNGSKVCFNANVLPVGATLLPDGGISVKALKPETGTVTVDMTEMFKQKTDGGKYKFTVQPEIEGAETDTTESPEITALARPKDEDLTWDGSKAVWKKVEGAEYYLLWLFNESGQNIADDGFTYKKLKDIKPYDDDSIQVNASGNEDEGVELIEVLDEYLDNVKFKLLAYSDACYTPQYVLPESEFSNVC